MSGIQKNGGISRIRPYILKQIAGMLIVVAVFAFAGLTLMVMSRAAVGPQPLGVGGSWDLVWGDEFNGSSLDSTKWVQKEPWNGPPGFNLGGDSEGYCPVPAPPEVLTFTGSSVKLNAVNKPINGYQFQSCFITSRDKYQDFTHGYLEAKVKLPAGARLWPAFWLLGNGTGDMQWPRTGEIDMFEFVNNGGGNGVPYYTVHWYDSTCPWGHCQRTQSDPWPAPIPDYTSRFVTFGLKRSSTELALYIDGKLAYKRTPADRADGNGPLLAQYLFDGPMHVRFDLGVGGAWATDPNRAAQPGSFEIDYFRAWKASTTTVDTTTPSVSLTAPANGSALRGSTTVAATATDNVGVSKVEFLVDGVLKSVDTSSPYEFAFDSYSVSNGSRSLTAKAYDTAGNVGTSTVTVTVENAVVAPVTVPFRMNAGGGQITDSAGQVWSADAHFSGGSVVDRGTAVPISNTTNDRLYQLERWGMSGYSIPVANGTYTYRLHFAETSPGCATIGCRIQTVLVEGSTALDSLDVFKEAGQNSALIKQGSVTVNDGNLSLGFSATVNAAMLNGIEILPPAPAALSDVVVTDVSMSPVSPAAGSQVVFSATIKNQGSGATPADQPVGVRFDVNGVQTHWAAINSLAPGETRTVLATNSMTLPDVKYWTAVAGTHTLKAWVDDVNRFPESNDTNNTLSEPFTVGGGPVSDVVPGDTNGDRRVNAIDLSIVLSKDGQNYAAADFNKDGVVGAADMAILLGKWTW